MKKLFIAVLALFVMLAFTACTDDSKRDNLPSAEEPPVQSGGGTEQPGEGEDMNETEMQIVINIGAESFTATLAENETAAAFRKKLPLTLDMSELNGNEKYNYLSENLHSQPTRAGTINAGDIMLYGSSCVVLFYETFQSSYTYTRIGKIDDAAGLKAALGSGSVTVTFNIK